MTEIKDIKLYSVNDVAALLNLSDVQIANYCINYSLPKFGKSYIILEEDIQRMRENKGKVGRHKTK